MRPHRTGWCLPVSLSGRGVVSNGLPFTLHCGNFAIVSSDQNSNTLLTLIQHVLAYLLAPALFVATAAQSENLGDAAERILSKVRETHYQHRTHVNKFRGAYDMDCSGFVDYLLEQFAPVQFAPLGIEPGHTRARAAMYFDLFTRLNKSPLPGWESVPKLGEARRGDIIAWKLAASTDRPEDTGHVVIVAGAPVEETTHLYRVQVYDSSVIHHDNDSRPEGTNGVGEGVITFRVDANGQPVGFQFNSRAHYHGEPIAIGRLVQS
jgi:hypothetical protein